MASFSSPSHSSPLHLSLSLSPRIKEQDTQGPGWLKTDLQLISLNFCLVFGSQSKLVL